MCYYTFHQDMEKGTGDYSVYVGSIPEGTSEEMLSTLFSQCGTIRGVTILPSPKGDFNFGFVGFNDFDSVEKAVQEMSNWPIQGSKLVVDYSKRVQGLPEYLERKKQASKAAEKKKVRQYPPTKEDFVYLSRVRDVCRDINKSAHQDDVVDMGRLLEDLENMECGRGPSLGQEVMNITVDYVLVKKKLQTCPLFCKGDYPVDEAEQFLKERSNTRAVAVLDSVGEAGSQRKRNRKKQEIERDIQFKDNPVLKSKLGKLVELLDRGKESSSPSNASTGMVGQEASTSSKEGVCKQEEDMGACADSSLPNGSHQLYLSSHQQCGPVVENGAAGSGTFDSFSLPSTPSDHGDKIEWQRQECEERRTPVNEDVISEQMASVRLLCNSPGDARTLGQLEDGAKQTQAATPQWFRQFAASPYRGSSPHSSPVTTPAPVQNGFSAPPAWQNGFGRGLRGHSQFESISRFPGQPNQ